MKTKLRLAISAVMLASAGLYAQQHNPVQRSSAAVTGVNISQTEIAHNAGPGQQPLSICSDKMKFVDRHPSTPSDMPVGGTLGWEAVFQMYPGYSGNITAAYATLRTSASSVGVRIKIYALGSNGYPTGSPLGYVDVTVTSTSYTEYGGPLVSAATTPNSYGFAVAVYPQVASDSVMVAEVDDPDQNNLNCMLYQSNLYTPYISFSYNSDFLLRPTISYTAPTESVVANPSSGCPGTPVNFSLNETNTPYHYTTGWTNIIYIPGADTYNWTFGDAGTSAIAAPTHTYSSSGTYTVNGTVTYPGWTTACAASGTTTVSMNGVVPAINIIATSTVVCVSDNVTFQANATGGGSSPSYQWKKNGFNVATGQTYSASGFVAGDQVQCFLTSNDPCASPTSATSNMITMAVQPGSISAFSYTANALVATFTNAAQNATSYLWDFGDSQTSTAPNPTHTFSAPGVYTVQLTTTNTCGSTNASQLNITVANAGNHSGSNVGIAEQTLSLSAQSYPNPAGNELNITYTMQHNADLTIEVVDALGQVVSTQQISGTSNGTATISMENLAPGIYFVRLTAGNETTMLRVAHQ